MTAPRTLVWFARHELRLAWRDMLTMLTGGRRGRERKVLWGILIVVGFMHVVAVAVLQRVASSGAAPQLSTLVAVTGSILLAGSAMLSQAMESVTRAFYTRSDLEFLLSAPVPSDRIFTVRIAAVAASAAAMSIFLMGPFIDVLAWRGGARWLCAYGVLIATSLTATALAVVFTAALFQAIGPRRTRLVAQIVAALIGGLFVIGLQIAALFSTGTYSRLAFLQSRYVMAHVPGADSVLWWPARAALGDPLCLTVVALAAAGIFAVVTALYAPRFAGFALSAFGVANEPTGKTDTLRPFRVRAAMSCLRRKERLLLLRDPWLISQSLMQLLYLLPPALLLLRSLGSSGNASIILVPVLIMSAGQLAGGLAWLAISGEDAPELVGSAPLVPSRLLRAKIEVVLQCIAFVFCPFAAALTLISPLEALVATAGIFAAALSSTAIQFWFRTQSSRNQFRRRHTSSRIATFAEAFVSISWAGAGSVAASGTWTALIIVIFPVVILMGARWLSPVRARTAVPVGSIAV